MAISALKVTASKADELEQIMRVDKEALRSLYVELANGNGSRITSLAAFGEFARKIIGAEAHRALVRNLLSLRHFSKIQDISASETLDALTAGLRRYGWDDEKIKVWVPYGDIIRDLISLDTVSILSKTAELALTHQTYIEDIKIFTELRPVFDEARDEIRTAVIYNELILFYRNSDEKEALTLSLTLEDLEKLKNLVDTALKKTQIAQDFANKATGTDTVIYSNQMFDDNVHESRGSGRA